MLVGKLWPIFPFFTNVNVVRLVRGPKRSSVKELMEVDSRCRLVSADQEERLLGSAPAVAVRK